MVESRLRIIIIIINGVCRLTSSSIDKFPYIYLLPCKPRSSLLLVIYIIIFIPLDAITPYTDVKCMGIGLIYANLGIVISSWAEYFIFSPLTKITDNDKL